jgi:hypothetical protein
MMSVLLSARAGAPSRLCTQRCDAPSAPPTAANVTVLPSGDNTRVDDRVNVTLSGRRTWNRRIGGAASGFSVKWITETIAATANNAAAKTHGSH